MHMQKAPSNASERSIGVQDILFILCKRKWLILVLALLGLGAAGTVYYVHKTVYQSDAKLLVRYVMETGSVDSYNTVKSPGGAGMAGDPVLITEMEILSSIDLATDVAGAIGIEKLAPNYKGLLSPAEAARVIANNLTVGATKGGSVLQVSYKNEDPALAKQVLRELIERYFNKHLEIHRSAAAFDMVSKQAEEVRGRLERTEKDLNRLRTESGVISLADATEALASQRNKISEELMQARADLAQQQAAVEALEKSAGIPSESADNGEAGEEQTDPDADEVEKPQVEAPSEIVTEYRALMELLAFLQKRDLELRVKYKPGSSLLFQNQQQMANTETRRTELLDQYPGLADEEPLSTASDSNDSKRNLDAEKARLAAVSAKVRILEENLKQLTDQFGKQYAYGSQIDALERRRQLEEVEYKTMDVNLKNARIDQALDPSRMPNITMVQQPTEPVKTLEKFTKMLVIGLAAGGLILGLGITFILELVLNRKIERPIDIQARLQLPLLLTIPYIRKNARRGLLLAGEQNPPRIGGGDGNWEPVEGKDGLSVNSQGARQGHFIMPFSETIRDRIIFNFQVNNVIHKPKLIAVTAMSEGAGASTIAAGLAKSFSEIRNAKVLLVDLSSIGTRDNPIFGEIPRQTLPGALRLAQDSGFRERAQNLYYANASASRDNGGLSQFTPLHLHEMMPLMHASEYDYIIFDMPAVAQTSPTLTMAGLMDKVLLILDAENTTREGLKWGYSELTKSRADVSCVFNKTRTHGPEWLIGVQ